MSKGSTTCAVLFWLSGACAAFGVESDYGYDHGFPSTPEGNRMRLVTYHNATSAANSWRSQLLQEDYTSFEAAEGFALNSVNPAIHFPVADVTATVNRGIVSNSASPRGVDDPAVDGPAGLYPTAGDQALFAPTGVLEINFSTPVSGFGFMLVDIPDESGFVVQWEDSKGLTTFGFIGPADEGNGSVLYFGARFTDPEEAATKVIVTASFSTDGFALDELQAHTRLARCLGDLNMDGLVNSMDLAMLLAKWGPHPGPPDLNASGHVDALDLAYFLALWGPCDPPAVVQPEAELSAP